MCTAESEHPWRAEPSMEDIHRMMREVKKQEDACHKMRYGVWTTRPNKTVIKVYSISYDHSICYSGPAGSQTYTSFVSSVSSGGGSETLASSELTPVADVVLMLMPSRLSW